MTHTRVKAMNAVVEKVVRALRWVPYRIRVWRSRLSLREDVLALVRESKTLKVIIGAASTEYEGWLNTDLPILNALNPAHWSYIFPICSIDRILAEHVIEHWIEDEFRLFLRIVQPFLAEQGFIRLAVPDGFHPNPGYIEWVRPGGTGVGADDHKVLYDYRSIIRPLSKERYEFRLLEHFDEKGAFHRVEWDASDGFVLRSADNDPRNSSCPLSYTSLIVDAWPARHGA